MSDTTAPISRRQFWRRLHGVLRDAGHPCYRLRRRRLAHRAQRRWFGLGSQRDPGAVRQRPRAGDHDRHTARQCRRRRASGVERRPVPGLAHQRHHVHGDRRRLHARGLHHHRRDDHRVRLPVPRLPIQPHRPGAGRSARRQTFGSTPIPSRMAWCRSRSNGRGDTVWLD